MFPHIFLLNNLFLILTQNVILFTNNNFIVYLIKQYLSKEKLQVRVMHKFYFELDEKRKNKKYIYLEQF